MIPNIIKESGFIKLPLVFNADIDNLKLNYRVNHKSNDTLLLEGIISGIIGFLPDTTNYYAFLYYTIGDMLYPTIRTMDKNWQKIDDKKICTYGCAGHLALNVRSCYDTSKGKRMRRLHSATVEPVLGTLLCFMRMRKVYTKGNKSACKQLIMAAAAYNLKKLMSTMRFKGVNATANAVKPFISDKIQAWNRFIICRNEILAMQ
jgi:hypothetical protein